MVSPSLCLGFSSDEQQLVLPLLAARKSRGHVEAEGFFLIIRNITQRLHSIYTGTGHLALFGVSVQIL